MKASNSVELDDEASEKSSIFLKVLKIWMMCKMFIPMLNFLKGALLDDEFKE